MVAIVLRIAELMAWVFLTGRVLWTHAPWDVWFCVVVGGLAVVGAAVDLLKAVDELR